VRRCDLDSSGIGKGPVAGCCEHGYEPLGSIKGLYQTPIQWILGALSPEVKRPGREADHSPPSSAQVKNAWNYTSTPNTPLWCGV
jgi:hypothetical protein